MINIQGGTITLSTSNITAIFKDMKILWLQKLS